MDRIIQDVRFGLKLLWKDKAFSATVLLTLGVCIGANATIFSVINTVLLKPLPYEEPDRLVTIFNSYPGAGAERSADSPHPPGAGPKKESDTVRCVPVAATAPDWLSEKVHPSILADPPLRVSAD